ncbi:MAG TPA: CHRD domain-containing protein [Ferruginibacter sp.]|nr:CHRD domain-containing protein [Ferruginibacter sp.]
MKKIWLISTILSVGFISCSKDDPAPPNPNVTFRATINGTSEVPANASTATGTATATFNKDTKILTMTVNYTGLTVTNAHIHIGAAGVPGGVVFPIAGPYASPLALTTIALTTAQETDLNANLYYVNLHSAAFPGGEIRGQLIKQ